MSEYFELAMRVGDLLDMQDNHFRDYVGFVRWVMNLKNNHSWDSVMRYDEAYRAEMELHPDWKWDRRPQDLERLHLVNRIHGDQKGGSYSGWQRKSYPQASGETCLNYNRDRCKAGGSCRRVHRCSLCEKQGHPASKCAEREPPKSQPGQASSQGKPGVNREL